MKPTLLFLLFSVNVSFGQSPGATSFIAADHPLIHWSGRTDRTHPTSVRFSYPGVSLRLLFEGNYCRVLLKNDDSQFKNYYTVLVDDQITQTVAIGKDDEGFQVTIPTKKGTHTLQLFKRTEGFVGEGIFEGVELEKGKKLLPLKNLSTRKIEFIGNSITCGYGNEGSSPSCHFSPETENNYMAYGAITARLLQAEYMAVAFSGKGLMQNYDTRNPETMPFLYDRINPLKPSPLWKFGDWHPDVVVINLGTNDFAHGIPDSIQFASHYVAFLERIRKNYPHAYLLCIEGCMTKDGWPTGVLSLTTVKRYIQAAVQDFGKKGNERVSYFFPTQMQPGEEGCDWHPQISRHQKMADELGTEIKKCVGW